MKDIYPIKNDDRLGDFTPEGDALIEALIQDAKGETEMADLLTRNVFDVLDESGQDVTIEAVEEAIDSLNDTEIDDLDIAMQEGDVDTIANLIIG